MKQQELTLGDTIIIQMALEIFISEYGIAQIEKTPLSHVQKGVLADMVRMAKKLLLSFEKVSGVRLEQDGTLHPIDKTSLN